MIVSFKIIFTFYSYEGKSPSMYGLSETGRERMSRSVAGKTQRTLADPLKSALADPLKSALKSVFKFDDFRWDYETGYRGYILCNRV